MAACFLFPSYVPLNKDMATKMRETVVPELENRLTLERGEPVRIVNVVCICQSSPTHQASAGLTFKGVNTQVFELSELQQNITRHVGVPDHIVLSESEIDEITKQLSVKMSELGKIRQIDPVARFLGLVPGMFVKMHLAMGMGTSETQVRVVPDEAAESEVRASVRSRRIRDALGPHGADDSIPGEITVGK